MKSHIAEFTPRELVRLVAAPLVSVVLFALLMHAGVRLRLLPSPRPTLDVDRTIIIHQAETSRKTNEADVLLLGDSSCLMDVNADQLSQTLGPRTLNLATISHLDLNAHALLLREFARANPGRPRAVVLLMHPEALRRVGPEATQLAVLTNFLSGTDDVGGESFEARIAAWSGANAFKGRLVVRALPLPLPGSFGREYGFSSDLERFMARMDGTVFDPSMHPPQGNAEYRLAPTLEHSSRAFRAAVPKHAKLLIGITPVPERFAGSKYRALRNEMLRQWNLWLQADATLDALPATLPDESFTGSTHLKPGAVPAFTRRLADAVRPHLE